MPPQASNFKGFDIVQRYDKSWAVYDFCWWPDCYLDINPLANEQWLEATGGWRAKGWLIVAVLPSYQDARDWCHNNAIGF